MNKKLVEYILSQEWYRKNFEATAFADYQWQAMIPYQKKDKLIKVHFKKVMTITSSYSLDWFWNQKELEEVRDWLVKSIRKDSKFAYKLVDQWHIRLGRYYKELNKLNAINLKDLSDKELAKKFKHLLYDLYVPTISLAVIVEGFSLNAEKWLGSLFKDYLIKHGQVEKFSEYFALLTQTTRPSFVQEAAIAKRNGMPPAQLAEKFYWIHFNYLHVRPLTSEFFKSWNPEHSPDFSQIKKNKKKLTDKIKLSKDFKNIFDATDSFTWWQDQRKKNALLTTEWMYKFLFEAGRRKKIPKELLLRALPNEMEQLLLKTALYRKVLQSRIDPMLVYADDKDETTVICGKLASSILNKIYTFSKDSVITGSATYLGVVRGKVVLVRGVNDIKRFKPGDILVASMTRPELTPILSIAGAIVTDEGGITSHAAIVSREMRKPCIIGTRVATKVLKDGDMVEVDANNGIVRKLK